jgi:menaquinol-cytochrome c reductase iron-sulfur subunit
MGKKNNKNSSISRRNFFRSAAAGLGSFLTIMIGYPLIDSLVSNSKAVAKRAYNKLGPLGNIHNSFKPVLQPAKMSFSKTDQDAFVTTKESVQVWIIKKSNDDVKVFSPVCPHLGCRYDWDEEKKFFVCPCHNSVFTIEGEVVSGPAPRGLDELPVEIRDESLYVEYEKFEAGIPDKIIID